MTIHPAYAATTLDFIEIGTHPQASAQPTAWGKELHDLAVNNGKIYAGYGDWNTNTGPIYINPFDLTTNTFEGSVLTVPTESIASIRNIDGKLYAPMTDPTTAWTANQGYAEQQPDGSWQNRLHVPMVHVFDVATLDGTDLWMVGSRDIDGVNTEAVAYRSVDGGVTWDVAQTAASDTASPYDRYYWVAALDGKIYMQARLNSYSSSLRSFDGTTWQTETIGRPCDTHRANLVEVFAGNIVCEGDGGLLFYSDAGGWDVVYLPSYDHVIDLYVDGTYLYALSDGHGIYRTSDLKKWQYLNTISFPTDASSIAVVDDYVYVGTGASKLLRSSDIATGAWVNIDDPTSCFQIEAGVIIGYNDHVGGVSTNPTCPKDVVIPSVIGGMEVTSIGDSAFYNNQITSVIMPDTVTSIRDGAFADNQITSVIMPDTVTSIGEDAFACNKLTFITVPDSVVSLGDGAFSCNNLTSVTLGNGLTALGRAVFAINKLTEVTIPDNIETIDSMAFFGQNPWGGAIDDGSDPAHDWFSDDLSVREQVFNNIWYVRLYTEDPTNPNELQDGITDESLWTYDINNDDDENDSIGGHLINASRTTIHYRSKTGATIAPIQTLTGQLDDDTDLSDYLVKNVETPVFDDVQNPTPEEQAELEDSFSVFYRSGDSRTFTPPDIADYFTPPSQIKTLTAGDNTVTFTYASNLLSVPFATNAASSGSLVSNSTPSSITSRLLTNSSLSISDDGECSTVQAATLVAPANSTVPDGISLLGGLDFTLECTTGATTTVTYTLGSQVDTAKLRVYKDIAGTLTDITSRVTVHNEDDVTIISYSLTDGAELDEDGIANGTIVDPLYIGLLQDSGLLASTGAEWHSFIAAGIGLILLGFAGGVMTLRGKTGPSGHA